MLCGMFKSVKDDGFDEIVIIISLIIYNKILGIYILLWFFGGEIFKNLLYCICVGFKV